jgi:hypothetical protein
MTPDNDKPKPDAASAAFAAAHGSATEKAFAVWWGRNCYSIRDTINGDVNGSAGRLYSACLEVWRAASESPNDKS